MLTGLVGQVLEVTAPGPAVGIGRTCGSSCMTLQILLPSPPEVRFEVGSRLETVANLVAQRLPPLGPREHPLRYSAGPSRLTARRGRREQQIDVAATVSGCGPGVD